jgi:hypothetical protein
MFEARLALSQKNENQAGRMAQVVDMFAALIK